ALDEPVDPSVPETLPMPLTRKLLEHGQERFNVFCSPCHGRTGYGNGMVVQRGFPSPPSFHIERLREAPLRHFYAVITDGFGVMYSYADRVPLEERWAIAAYIQALQLSQYAEVDDLTPRLMAKLGEAPPAVTREAGTVTHEPSLDDGTARGESRITPKAPAGEASQ
ncbi:MAG: cytochrome c, partial [Halomonas sp.]|nr:cytochrome c [Halomonas sp.]